MFDFIRNLRKSDEEKWQDQINSYLENDLSPADRQRFEQKLGGDELLQREIAHRQAILQAMRKMPARPAPRNFTLTPDMVGVQTSAPVWYKQPTFRVVGALAAIVLVAMIAYSALQQNVVSEPSTVAMVEEQIVEVTRVATEIMVEEVAQVEVTRVVEVVVQEEAMAADEVAEDVAAFGANTADSDNFAEAEMAADAETFAAEPTSLAPTPAFEGEGEIVIEAEPQVADDAEAVMAEEAVPPEESLADSADDSGSAAASAPIQPTVAEQKASPSPEATQTLRPAPRQPTDTPPPARVDGTAVSAYSVEIPATGVPELVENRSDVDNELGAEIEPEDKGGNAGIFLTIGTLLILLIGFYFWRRK